MFVELILPEDAFEALREQQCGAYDAGTKRVDLEMEKSLRRRRYGVETRGRKEAQWGNRTIMMAWARARTAESGTVQ